MAGPGLADPMSDVLRSERRGRVLALTLHRPECRNALSRELIAELTGALEASGADPNLGAVLLMGTPPAFCAGLDLREVAAETQSGGEHATGALLGLYTVLDCLPKPVIAAVNGGAMAGGAGLLTVCDAVLCSESATVGFPGILRGLVAPVLMGYVVRAVGAGRARYLLLTGRELSAQEALAWGLVHEIVPDPGLIDRAWQRADGLAEISADAYARTKALLARLAEHAGDDPAEQSRELGEALWLTEEAREALGRFLSADPRTQQPPPL